MAIDENANWFPHPSPDNKWIVYMHIPLMKTKSPFGKNVKPFDGCKTKTVKDITVVFFGGAGTINNAFMGVRTAKIAFDRTYSVK